MDNDRKKPIILVNYTGRHGGGPLDAYEMAKALIQNGMPVAAVISAQIENLEEWKNLALQKLVVIQTYSSAASFLKNHMQFLLYKKYCIRKKFKGYSIQAVYCPMCTFWTYPINRLFPKAKSFVVCHDPVPHAGENYIWINKLCGVDRAYKKADEIIVHTKKFISYVEQRYHKAGHVHYLPLGRHNFYKNIKQKRQAVTYGSHKANFVFFGRITPYKGLDTLADAYRMVYQRCQDITLTIAGSGDFGPYQEKYKGLAHVTVINRWLDDDEVESIFTGENLIALLPYNDATQSGVLLTAMDCGVPVIAADTGGISEQAVDGVTGILVPPNDSVKLAERMAELMDNKDLYQQICQNVEQKLKTMEWQSAAEQLAAQIKNICR